MSDDFPRSVDAISNAWLFEVLGAPVSGIKTTYLEGGVLPDAYKLHEIAYAGTAPGAPESVVVKLAQREQERRDAALDTNAYVKELHAARRLRARSLLL